MAIRFLIIFIFCLFLRLQAIGEDSIRVAHQKNYYPYSYVDEWGNPSGILIDWWNLWAEKTNSHIKFVPGSTVDCIEMLLENKVDAAAGLFFDSTYVDDLEYTEFIIPLRSVIFLKKGYRPNSIKEIDKPIAVIKNEISHRSVLDSYPDLKMEFVNTWEEFESKIDEKSFDGFIYEVPNPLVGYEFKVPSGYREFEEIKTDRLRPAVRTSNRSLLQLLLVGSALITNNERLLIASNYGFEENPDYDIYIISGLIGLVVLLSLVYWKSTRKNQNQANIISNLEQKDWQDIIAKGENDKIEFKSSLKWDFNQDKVNKALEIVIAKTISAFLNSDGGMLLIGVNDNGNVVGLENDYQTMSKKNSDGFVLAMTNLINQNLGKKTHKHISMDVISINEKDICIVKIEKCDAPVFLTHAGKEEFYIRASASSQPMAMSEAFAYIKTHWAK